MNPLIYVLLSHQSLSEVEDTDDISGVYTTLPEAMLAAAAHEARCKASGGYSNLPSWRVEEYVLGETNLYETIPARKVLGHARATYHRAANATWTRSYRMPNGKWDVQPIGPTV
jgi:hypothetical protein